MIQAPRRSFGSGGGTRGARGHGWWINYRAGKGGRHLQGDYNDTTLNTVESMAHWNDAVFALGKQRAYFDIQIEGAVNNNNNNSDTTNSNTTKNDTVTTHRLELELATTALPRATDNFMKLLQVKKEDAVEDDTYVDGVVEGYASSTLYRVEKGVGLLGGLVTKNPNRHPLAPPSIKAHIGKCHPTYTHLTSMTAMDISQEKLVLSHVPGVLTMLQPRIGEIDSRFMMLTHPAPHLDGISVAIGRVVTPQSLDTIQLWQSTLITSYGVPTNQTLRIVGCGLLGGNNNNDNENENGETTANDTRNNETQKQMTMES